MVCVTPESDQKLITGPVNTGTAIITLGPVKTGLQHISLVIGTKYISNSI